MAYSYCTYTGNGELQNYSVPFPYLIKSHVKVYIQGIQKLPDVHFTWLNDAVIHFIDAPLEGEIIFFQRNSGRDARMVDWVTGGFIKEEYLDLDSNQLFYLMQEAFDILGKAQDTENAIFTDQAAILDAIHGNISKDYLEGEFVKPIDYLEDYWLSDALFETDVYEEGVHAVGYARLDLMQDRIDAVVADTSGHTAQLSLMANEFFVKLDDNDHVSGFGLFGDGETSSFIVNSDYFAIVNADDPDDIQYPFIVDTETDLVGVDGNLVVTGSITGDKIAANTVEASNIKAGTITATEISTGGVNGTNIAEGTIDTVNLKADAVTGDIIKGGEITADHMAALSISTAALQVGSVDDTIIASGAVTTQKIYASAVTATHIGTNEVIASAANIKNAIITGAKIGNAEVDSLQIKGNAVTIPVSAYTADVLNIDDGGFNANTQSCSITATGSPIFINMSCMLAYLGESSMTITVRLLRDSTTVYSGSFKMLDGQSIPYASTISDTPSAGNHTYHLQFGYVTGTNLAASCRSILLLEVKR